MRISAGYDTSLAISSNGTVTTWGYPFSASHPNNLMNIIDAVVVRDAGCAIAVVDEEHLPVIYPGHGQTGGASFFEYDELIRVPIMLTLSAPYYEPITVSYSSRDGTAEVDEDYLPISGFLVIQPFTKTTNLALAILGDILAEPQEEFFIDFLQVSNAVMFHPEATIRILDSDHLRLAEGVVASEVVTNLHRATRMEFAPDGRLFVCEQAGSVRLITNGALSPKPVMTLNVTTEDDREAGLLGFALHPNFESNGFFYVYYTVPNHAPWPNYVVNNRVSRFHLDGEVADTNSETVLLDLGNLPGAYAHNGGAIHFGPDGKLYVGVGDNANRDNAQVLTNLLGKILRLQDDGTIPSDNPFYSVATGNNRAIWALDFRNPFSFAFEPGTGRMLINDVGESTWEEINEGQPGANYGWPAVEGVSANSNYRNPLYAYLHGTNQGTGCAIVGAAFPDSSGSAFAMNDPTSFFFADFCTEWIGRLGSNNFASEIASGLPGVVDLKFGSDGSLYCLISLASARIYRFRSESGARITSVRPLSTGVTGIRAAGQTGQWYYLEASSDLRDWIRVDTNYARGPKMRFSDLPPEGWSQRFYRVVEQERDP